MMDKEKVLDKLDEIHEIRRKVMCEYCESSKRLIDEGYDGQDWSEMYISGNELQITVICEGLTAADNKAEIKFCPMCGRLLNDTGSK